MISTRGLTKRFGARTAVDGLTLDVRPARVTGFLGPNGAGKSTTMRMVLGVDPPDAGTATINGHRVTAFRHPLREVGALLDGAAPHPGRGARAHLTALACSNGIPRSRVEEVLELSGIAQVAHRRAGGYSLGMRQRLGIAAALLGDPGTLLLDEPVNGLDPDGVVWMRKLLRELADDGRTVLVSSHLLGELEHVADQIVIMAEGRLLVDAPAADVITRATRTRVRSPHASALATVLDRAGARVERDAEDGLTVTGRTSAEVGTLAAEAGLTLYELAAATSLEDAYRELTADAGAAAAGRVPAHPLPGGTGREEGSV